MLIDDVVGMGMGTNCGPMVRSTPTIQALWFLFALVCGVASVTPYRTVLLTDRTALVAGWRDPTPGTETRAHAE